MGGSWGCFVYFRMGSVYTGTSDGCIIDVLPEQLANSYLSGEMLLKYKWLEWYG